MTILIVDDNATVRRLIRQAIGQSAADFVECADGADAVAAYETCQPDLVLMDIHMPRMDGLAATRQLRLRYPEARIVIVTDYDDDDLRSAAKDAGACGYALKQNLTELEALIDPSRR
jgi:CheY-like chemotaxis protein